jgi:hypothetical protein
MLGAGSASAHTVLGSPPPLTPQDDAKIGPCGCVFEGEGVICPADYTTTEVVAGEQLAVTWVETVDHAGSFRVAISANPVETVSVEDLDNGEIVTIPDENIENGGEITTTIVVPNTPCDSCTLQVRQLMEGAADPFYFTCASIRIVDGGSGQGGGGPATTAGSGGSPATSGGDGGTSAGNGGPGPTGGDQWEPEPAEGCSVSNTAPSSGLSSIALAAMALAVSRRSARRSR